MSDHSYWGLAILECPKTWIHTAATAWSSRSLPSWNCRAWPIVSTDTSRGRIAFPSVQKRDSSPRNQEKETGCRDIWVATVAELCYIFFDPMFAHHHDCVSRGALWLGDFVNSKARVLLLSNNVSLLVTCRCVRVLLPTFGCSIFGHFDVHAWTEKKTYSHKQGFPEFSQKSLWMTKGGESLEQRNPTLIRKGQCLLEQSGSASLTTCCWRCTESRG